MAFHLSDRAKRWTILGPTMVLPRPLRVRVRRTLLERLEIERAEAARLVIVGHPKSGNTWLRTMLSRLYQVRFGMPSDFTVKTDELALRHPLAPRLLASNGWYSYEAVLGEALAESAADSPLRRKPVVLLARHPSDIAVSWYHQFTRRQSAYKRELINACLEHRLDHRSIDMWSFVRHSEIGLPMLIDFLNTWERRVSKLPRGLIVRYEDLREDPVPELRRITQLMGEDFHDKELAAAAEWGSFENMSKLELEGHFRSGGIQKRGSDASTRKVRRGKVGGYREDFDATQVKELEALVAGRLSPSFGYTKLDSAPDRARPN
jgi:hypothetical protein